MLLTESLSLLLTVAKRGEAPKSAYGKGREGSSLFVQGFSKRNEKSFLSAVFVERRTIEVEFNL